MSKKDLTHADWLMFSQEHLIRQVNPNIATKIVKLPNKNYLVASNITSEDIVKLKFLTNTDKNNNYLYLETLKVYLDNSSYAVNIHGLKYVILDIFRKADVDAFINESNVFYPFSPSNYNGLSFSAFINDFTDLVPNSPKTSGHLQTYTIVLNPDESPENSGSKALLPAATASTLAAAAAYVYAKTKGVTDDDEEDDVADATTKANDETVDKVGSTDAEAESGAAEAESTAAETETVGTTAKDLLSSKQALLRKFPALRNKPGF